jgi:hypothetical protein
MRERRAASFSPLSQFAPKYKRSNMTVRNALFTLVVALGSGSAARADLIYSFTTTNPAPVFGPVSGFFTVPDAAIGDGSITEAEITDYSFSDLLVTFAPPSTFLDAIIPVDSTTGVMTFLGVIAINENLDLLNIFTGPGTETYIRGDFATGVVNTGNGVWSVSSAPAIPEPSSIALLLMGVAVVGGATFRRRWR